MGPKRDFDDHHHIIKTALRAINHNRPAGSIFRDLLLNADDAGATSFELILDPYHHPTDHLIHYSLTELRNPSLLVCDNSMLAQSDFESISWTRDSLGLPGHDLAGRDLDSVDSWSDSPSVLSGSTLQILGSRLGGSAERVGRPTYDFVQQSDRSEVRNQMVAFEAVQHDFNTEFTGTIVRIPLSTDEQVARSVVGCGGTITTEADIRSAFSEFREELVELLLFLKNIVSITLRIAGEEGVYAKAEVETQGCVGGRGSVAAALREIFVDRSRIDFDVSLPVVIHHQGCGQNDSISEWVIFHHARSQLGTDEELVKWAEARGLVPHVGLAALVRVEEFGRRESGFCGRLFTRLPLPIYTHQAVHINGMFSPMPGCGSIYHVRDRTVENDGDMDHSSRWNSTLFEECLTFAWSRFLLSLTATRVPVGDGFQYWPRNIDQDPRSGDWTSFMNIFLEVVVRTELPIWPTCQGWLGANKVFLAQGDQRINVKGSNIDIQDTIHALEKVGMPITYPPSEIYGDARECFKRIGQRFLTPITAARFLRAAPDKLARASQDVRRRLLNYLLSESPQTDYTHLEDIELFPMCDGSFAASGTLSPPVLMLPMDDEERKLFNLRPYMTIDVRNIGAKVLQRLRKDIENVEKETTLKQWGLESVYEYYMATYFFEVNPYVTSDVVQARDVCASEQGFAENLGFLWEWIISRMPEDASIISLSRLGELWLIPIMGGIYRRVNPMSKQLLLDPSSREELGDFLKSVCETKEGAYQTNQLYRSDLMSASTTEFFRKHKIIQACDNLENLMNWLEQRPRFISLFCAWERNELVRFLEMLSIDFLKSKDSSRTRPHLLSQFRRLPVFEEIRNNSKGTSLNWTTLDIAGVTKYVAVTMECVVPDLDSIVFLNAQNPSTLWLLRQFELAEVPNMPQLLGEYVLPGISAQTTPVILERLAAFALDNLDSFPAGGVERMTDMQFVPVQSRADCGVVAKFLKTPRQCVDPRSGLGDLFFAYESAWIDDEFWGAYSGKLVGMKLIDKITVELVLDRVRAYCDVPSGVDTDELARKVEMMIISSTELEIPNLRCSGKRPWLPATTYPSGVIVLANPEDCRDKSFTGLVGYAMPIISFTVGRTWSKALGWDCLIPSITIQKQLQILVDRREFSGLGIILNYLEENGQISGYLDGLREMKWIVGVSGEVFKYEDIFFNHAARLGPSCDCIDNRLGERYRSFFVLLGVQENPGLSRLKRLIDDLDQGGILGRSDLDLAVDAILLATELYPHGDFTKFKAPDHTNTLRDISTLTVGKPEYYEAELFFLHSRIPQQSISVLGVPTLDQRQLDVVETHSDQGPESAETRVAIIRNTMGHFPAECTFNIYLGNVENSGTATNVGWILDRSGVWDKISILTEELSDTMGPALLCWSDGVLEENDLSGLLRIVGGIKNSEMEGNDKYSPGMLAMFHWSSVPQIISRDYFIILDPEEKYLPLDRHTKRRYAGMKISLQKVRGQYTDHLKPFYGVLGFGPESDYLDGTIFRLPFRKPGSGSGLVPDNLIIDAENALMLMVNYFTEAKNSLLFLTRITTIEFRMKDAKIPDWKISVTRDPVKGAIFSGSVEQIFIESRQLSPTPSIVNDEWRLARREVLDASVPENLEVTQKGHRLGNLCGIAALVSHRYAGSGFNGQFFSSLPLSRPSRLPVHVQAPFIITDSEVSNYLVEGVQHPEFEWNSWILDHGVVELYLDFLQYLSNDFGELSFKFWPPHEGAPDLLSEKLGKVFWRKVLESDLKLFTIKEHKPKMPILNLRSVRVDHELPRKTLSFTEVVFDCLEPEYSNILRVLLERLGVKNIVRPTEAISRALQQYPERITKIDPPYVSSLLRGNPKSDALYEIWAADNYSLNRLGPFLEFMVKKPSLNSDILTECRILPLADLTLGTLRKSCIQSVYRYYVSQNGTLDLFDYAPSLVVHPDVPQATINIILKLGLNVSILPPCDLPRLFVDVNENDKVSMRFHCFLLKFWVAVRYEYEGRPKIDLSNLPVYSATVNGRLQAISPNEFQSLPAIVSPDDEGESAICSRLPSLYLVDRRTISTAMQKTEQLATPVGLMRFITSLGKLAKLKHKTTETFFSLFLGLENITLLRQLVKRVVSKQVLVNYSSATLILKSLPLWPTMSGKLVSAADALLAPDLRFCIPWIGGQQRFIEPGASQEFSLVLQLLEVNKLEAPEFISSYFRNTIDQKLTATAVKNCRSFIEAYIEHIGVIPPDCALALDGNCCFRLPRDLYDHNESIFIAAFRGVEKGCFLHPVLRHLKDWYMPGLRSAVSGLHYYECATYINKRASLPGSRIQLEFDAATVFGYLRTNQDFAREHWSATDLRRIEGVQFVPLLRHLAGQPHHRKEGMNKISSTRIFGSLEDSVNAEYLDVCWSQCPLYAKPPGDYVLQQIPSKGVPSIQVIFRHIEYLAVHRNEVRSLHDIQYYIKDIQASYRFLDNHYGEMKYISEKARDTDPRALDTVMWLNLNEPIDANFGLFETSWVSAKDLCLGIDYDFGHYRYVRSTLVRYGKLLTALEVKKIQKPKLEGMGPDLHQQKSTHEKLFGFWQQGKLCDVELDVGGVIFKAHRIVLASGSSYWENMLIGGWRDAGERSISINEMPARTVSVMLNFLYTGELPPSPAAATLSENLQHMMDWLVAADQWDMAVFKNHIEEMIVQRDYVRPENVRQVLGIAREAQAKTLSNYCEAYIKENQKLIERIDYPVM